MTGKDLIEIIVKNGLSDLPVNTTADVYCPDSDDPRPIISFEKYAAPNGKSGTDIWLDTESGEIITNEWECE